MDEVINYLSKKPFSDKDIYELSNGTRILKYSELNNYRSLDELLKPYKSAVILYEFKENYGHWVAIIDHGNEIEFFDSYGYKPDYQIKFCNKLLRGKFGLNYILTELLYNSGKDIIYNNHPLQSNNSKISTCGRYCAFRVAMKHLKLNKFLNLFKHNQMNNDMLISYLTGFQN